MNLLRGVMIALPASLAMWLLIALLWWAPSRDVVLFLLGIVGFIFSVKAFLRYHAAAKADRFLRSVRNLEGWR